jgi:hypothetical protein
MPSAGSVSGHSQGRRAGSRARPAGLTDLGPWSETSAATGGQV